MTEWQRGANRDFTQGPDPSLALSAATGQRVAPTPAVTPLPRGVIDTESGGAGLSLRGVSGFWVRATPWGWLEGLWNWPSREENLNQHPIVGEDQTLTTSGPSGCRAASPTTLAFRSRVCPRPRWVKQAGVH